MKRILSLVLTAAMTLSLASVALAAESQPWYAEAVSYVTEHEIMKGTGNGFEPDADVTRASIFELFWNMEGQPEGDPCTFPDVKST